MPPHDLEGPLTAVTQGFTRPKTSISVNLAQTEFLIIGSRLKKVKGLLKVKIKIPNAYYKLPPPLSSGYLPTHASTASSNSQVEPAIVNVRGRLVCMCSCI